MARAFSGTETGLATLYERNSGQEQLSACITGAFDCTMPGLAVRVEDKEFAGLN